jgi:hypothetical protein
VCLALPRAHDLNNGVMPPLTVRTLTADEFKIKIRLKYRSRPSRVVPADAKRQRKISLLPKKPGFNVIFRRF